MTVDDFFANHNQAKILFESIQREVEAIGEASIRVSKSQIAFRRKRNFALVWMPSQYLKGKTAPLVLTISFDTRNPSKRWKEITEVSTKHFTHHLELRDSNEIDDEVREWLRKAWEVAV